MEEIRLLFLGFNVFLEKCFCHLESLLGFPFSMFWMRESFLKLRLYDDCNVLKDLSKEFAFVDTARKGKCLTKNQKQHSYLVSVLDCVLARIIVAILWPIHMLAKKILYSKIQSAIGLSKVLGSIGRPVRHTEIKVVDSLTDDVLPHGVKGIVKAGGPQVMKGYYKACCKSNFYGSAKEQVWYSDVALTALLGC